MEGLTNLSQWIMNSRYMQDPIEIVTEQHRSHGKITDYDRRYSQQYQRHPNHGGWLFDMVFGMFISRAFTMKHQKIHSETVQGGDKYTRH